MRKFRLKPVGDLRFFQKPVEYEKPFEWMPFLKTIPLSILVGSIILAIMALMFIANWLLSPPTNSEE